MRICRGHETKNPALYLFRVTGFWVTIHIFKSSFRIGLKEETRSGILLNAVYTYNCSIGQGKLVVPLMLHIKRDFRSASTG